MYRGAGLCTRWGCEIELVQCCRYNRPTLPIGAGCPPIVDLRSRDRVRELGAAAGLQGCVALAGRLAAVVPVQLSGAPGLVRPVR